jgi:hypothetical protein
VQRLATDNMPTDAEKYDKALKNNMEKKLPLYDCHKQVRASKIGSIVTRGIKTILNCTDADGYAHEIEATDEYMERNKPEVGGYYVLYVDGYHSYSPAKAFEDGYTLVKE